MKEIKRVNTFFLILVVLHIGASLIVSLLDNEAVRLGTFSSLMLTQLLILVPSFLFFLISGYDISEWIPVRRLKSGTVVLVIVFTFLVMPLISAINIFSQLFTENVAVDMMGEIAGVSPVITILIVGLFGPFCEEFTFRGVIYGGLRKSGFFFAAAAVTGIFFGLMHLNLNQFSYALVLGLVLSLLVEATGSIWSSIIAHMTVNTWNVFLMIMADRFYSSMGLDIFKEAAETITRDDKFMMMGFLLVISVITTLLAAGVFVAICSHEGRTEEARAIFKAGRSPDEDNRDGRIITLSGYIAIAVCLFVIFFLDKILMMFVK